jgi:hypothetical protein
VKNIIELICRDLASPDGRNLQQCCLQSMVLMERYRGIGTEDEIAPETADADISSAKIARLAESLATFIASYPHHADVGSATWALGKLRKSDFAPLFEKVLSASGGYDHFARHQAVVALQDLGIETNAP